MTEEVICHQCEKPTGYTTDHRILYDQYGSAANKAKSSHFLLHGFDCPKCGGKTFWTALTPLEQRERQIRQFT